MRVCARKLYKGVSQEALQMGLIEPKNCASEHFGLQHGALEGLGKLCKTRRHRARTAHLSGYAQLRYWEPGPSGSPGSGLRDCGGDRSLDVVRFARPRRSSSSQGPKAESRCFDAHCRIEVQNRKCRCGPHVLTPGSCRALSPGPRQPRNTANRRRRAQPRPDDDDV